MLRGALQPSRIYTGMASSRAGTTKIHCKYSLSIFILQETLCLMLRHEGLCQAIWGVSQLAIWPLLYRDHSTKPPKTEEIFH
jgi:hypothetical protein